MHGLSEKSHTKMYEQTELLYESHDIIKHAMIQAAQCFVYIVSSKFVF